MMGLARLKQFCLTNKYSPIFFCILLAVIQFYAGYPGGMTSDSFDQYGQSLTGEFNPYHPPMMAILWSLFHKIYVGPQTMLAFHILCLWVGVGFLYYSDANNKYKFLYLLLPFLPNILGQSSMIWKDIAFANALFLCLSICTYYILRAQKAPAWVVAGVLLTALYACSVKFQASYLIPFVVWSILCISNINKVIYRLLATAIISGLFFVIQNTVVEKLSYQSPTWQFRVFFDLAAVANDLNDDSILPNYIRRNDAYSFAKLQEKFTSRYADPMIWPEDRIYSFTKNESDLAELSTAFRRAIVMHPFLYLKHRIVNFFYIMKKCDRYDKYLRIDATLAKKYNFDFQLNTFQKLVVQYLKIYPTPLSSNLISFMLLIAYLAYLVRSSNTKGPYNSTIFYSSIICLIYTVVMLITTQADDYRYYYVVRLITIMSIPLYLQARQQSIQVN